MNPAPTTRHRLALRWVLGVGLVFVVVVAMALQVARRRADERCEGVLTHLQDSGWEFDHNKILSGFRGNNFLVWFRRCELEKGGISLVLEQRRVFFGSSMKAYLRRDDEAHWSDIEVLLQEVGVQLVGEYYVVKLATE